MKRKIGFCLLLLFTFAGILIPQERIGYAQYKGEKLYYSTEQPLPSKYDEDIGILAADIYLMTEYGCLLIPKESVVHSFANELTSLTFIDNKNNTLNICGILFGSINGIYFGKPNQGISSVYSQNPQKIFIGKYLLSPCDIEINEWENTIFWGGGPPPYNKHRTITLRFMEFPSTIILEDGTEITISSISFEVQLKIIMDIH